MKHMIPWFRDIFSDMSHKRPRIFNHVSDAPPMSASLGNLVSVFVA